LITSTFSVFNHYPLESGSLSLDGVNSSSSPIRLDFLNPSGSMTGRLLPTGLPIQTITIPRATLLQAPGYGGIAAIEDKSYTISCVDAANPFVFVLAEEFGLKGSEDVKELEAISTDLMAVREHAAVLMGLAPSVEAARLVQGTPKIALVGRPKTYIASSKRVVHGSEFDIWIRPFSMGKPHPAIQITGAVCVGAACAIPGTVINNILEEEKARLATGVSGTIPERKGVVVGHASGTMSVDGDSEVINGETIVRSGSVYRTARRLMEGRALYIV
jgi:2-methylaconitate cis-trans-isomerase PrpF